MDLLAVDAPHLKSRCRSSGETSKTRGGHEYLPKAFQGVNLMGSSRQVRAARAATFPARHASLSCWRLREV